MSAEEDAFINLFAEACLHGALYQALDLPDISYPVEALFKAEMQFDAHCVSCGRESLFRLRKRLALENNVNPNDANFPDPALIYFRGIFTCNRDPDHLYAYFWHYHDGKLVKVGQSPAIETIATNDIQRFKKILGGEYFSELHRATGLISHGIGIGSFVYLRRIFEKLIADHKALFDEKHGPIEGYDTLRMSEKIGALKSVLPPTVVKYKSMYGILSKGIHELSEQECREYFPVLKAAIIAILEEDLQNRNKLEKEREMQLISDKISQKA